MTAAARSTAVSRPTRGWRAVLGNVLTTVLLTLVSAAGAHAQQMPGGGRPRTTSMTLDRTMRTFLLADLLEYSPSGPTNAIRVEGLGWIGGDYNRLWLRAEGDQPTARGQGEWQADAYYGRLVSPFWNAVVGARLDTRSFGGRRATRGLLAVGFEGLAPYWLEVEPRLYVGQKGDLSAQFTTAFDLLFTQRLIVQPRLELNAALQKVPAFGVGAGLNDVELGARARYEFRREFAPYLGVSWRRRTGGTAVMARRAGEEVSDVSLVAGVRLWR